MLSSFELNLSALSLISLLVGMFLIYNTITASVVRRRVETGILRAVGASRLEVQCLFLGEAVLFGFFGVLLGLVGGTLLARLLLGREIARVISTLYMLVSVDRYYLTPLLVGSAMFFGLGSVLAAAWLPAWEGARANPVVALSLGLGDDDGTQPPAHAALAVGGALALLVAGGCSAAALSYRPGVARIRERVFRAARVRVDRSRLHRRRSVRGGVACCVISRLRWKSASQRKISGAASTATPSSWPP